MTPRVLLLGGVGDALWLARHLGPRHVYSLAGLGRVADDLSCAVRVGGFGGVDGLASYLNENAIDLLIDATHPYAARISQNAVRAARLSGVTCWALRRPAWVKRPGDRWIEVNDWNALQTALVPFRRPLFTLGREPLQHLDAIPAHQLWTIRLLDPQPIHPRATFIATRGPFSTESERALFTERRFDVIVSKNSGGSATQAKLDVARTLELPVLMLSRPALPMADRIFADRGSLLSALGEEQVL